MTVLVSFVILIAKLRPNWGEVFEGYLPSKTIGKDSNALYTSIGIIGATVMPHALFLGSQLATQNRDGSSFLLHVPGNAQSNEDSADDFEEPQVTELENKSLRRRFGEWLGTLITAERVKGDYEEDEMIDRLRFVQSHLKNAIIDIGG